MTFLSRIRRPSILAVALPLAAFTPGRTTATETAVFRDGRSMVVASRVQAPGGWLVDLPEGGSVLLSQAQVDRFDPRSDPPAEVPAVAAPAPASVPAAGAGPIAIPELVRSLSDESHLDPRLVEAVIWVESHNDKFAVSPKGAAGLMQLMPGTARQLGVTDVFDPSDNIRGGVRYLRQLSDRFGGNLALVLAAYNAGEGAVQKHLGVPPYHETRQYVIKVLERYLQKLPA
jgi:hypothetical protein